MLVLAQQYRNKTLDVYLVDANGTVIVPGASDTIRAIVCREKTLETDLSGAALTVIEVASDNGSLFTKDTVDGSNRLRFDADDLDFNPGTYVLFIDYKDNADADDWKNGGRHVFVLEPSA